MTDYSGSRFRNLNRSPRVDLGQSRSAVDAATKLAPGAGLILAVLLSLGLWGAIWQTVHSLTAVWFR